MSFRLRTTAASVRLRRRCCSTFAQRNEQLADIRSPLHAEASISSGGHVPLAALLLCRPHNKAPNPPHLRRPLPRDWMGPAVDLYASDKHQTLESQQHSIHPISCRAFNVFPRGPLSMARVLHLAPLTCDLHPHQGSSSLVQRLERGANRVAPTDP